MATIILRPRQTTRYGSSATLSNVSNIWDGNSSTYATFSTSASFSSQSYLFVKKFDYSSIPEGVQITSAKGVVEISTTRVSTTLIPTFEREIINGTVTLGIGTFSPTLTVASSADHISSATITAEEFATLKSYGEEGGIVIPLKKSTPIGGNAEEKIYEVYIEVTYSTEPIPTGTNNTRVGDLTPSKYCVGNNEVNKIYQGSDLIYES